VRAPPTRQIAVSGFSVRFSCMCSIVFSFFLFHENTNAGVADLGLELLLLILGFDITPLEDRRCSEERRTEVEFVGLGLDNTVDVGTSIIGGMVIVIPV